jgi:hypothetical protein
MACNLVLTVSAEKGRMSLMSVEVFVSRGAANGFTVTLGEMNSFMQKTYQLLSLYGLLSFMKELQEPSPLGLSILTIFSRCFPQSKIIIM